MKPSWGTEFSGRWPGPLFNLVLLAAWCAPGTAYAGQPASGKTAPPGKLYKVKVYRDITYRKIPGDPDRKRHQLDVFCPKGKTGCPVLFFVHGGAWVACSKDDVLGIYGYGTIAEQLAQHGLLVVLPNYRLSPGVRHPEHVKDVARAFAWTCQNARQYGGDPGQIFVGGHSAGAHLASLLATDQTYLEAEGRSRKDIRGVIAVSGVFRVDDLDLKLSVAGPCPCLRFNCQVTPLASVFGKDAEVLKRASPFFNVRPGLPPFLLINGDLEYCPLRPMVKEFAAALKQNGCEVEVKEVPWRTHETVLFDIGHLAVDPATTEAILKFIDRHVPRPGADSMAKGG